MILKNKFFYDNYRNKLTILDLDNETIEEETENPVGPEINRQKPDVEPTVHIPTHKEKIQKVIEPPPLQGEFLIRFCRI